MSGQHLSEVEVERVISGQGSTVETQNHLADCSQCQNEVDKASADHWWWNEGRELIASTVKLKERFGSPPTPIESTEGEGYNPTAAEVQELIGSFEDGVHPELLGRVGEYVIESLIGVGGMGAVFKGLTQELNRRVAIKFLLPRHASSKLARERFSAEAKAIAAVSDKNVIPVFGINSAARYPYFSMPLIAGVSLKQFVLENGPLAPLELVQAARQIAAGLSAAHRQKLIHRDVKPANILIEDGSNRVVVTDFGLAQEESELGLTQTGMIAGTPMYMSPEQADGRKLDQRSDLFSLGSVMFFMATGQPPFQSENQLELLKNIREATPPGVRKFNPEIPVRLEQAIQRLLKKDPEHRFQRAAEAEEFLSRFEAYLCSPRRNRQPRLPGVRRSTNYFRCLIAIAITSVVAMLFTTFTNWHAQTGLIPSIQFVPVAPCYPAPTKAELEKAVAVELDDEASKREHDGYQAGQ